MWLRVDFSTHWAETFEYPGIVKLMFEIGKMDNCTNLLETVILLFFLRVIYGLYLLTTIFMITAELLAVTSRDYLISEDTCWFLAAQLHCSALKVTPGKFNPFFHTAH